MLILVVLLIIMIFSGANYFIMSLAAYGRFEIEFVGLTKHNFINHRDIWTTIYGLSFLIFFMGTYLFVKCVRKKQLGNGFAPKDII